MWPVEARVGNFALSLTDDSGHHFCYYYAFRSSLRKMGEGTAWFERCRCGRYKHIDWKYVVEGSNSPQRTIRWYDAEGNLERVTGDGVKTSTPQKQIDK